MLISVVGSPSHAALAQSGKDEPLGPFLVQPGSVRQYITSLRRRYGTEGVGGSPCLRPLPVSGFCNAPKKAEMLRIRRFVYSQTDFAKFIGVDEKRELMGARTTLSQKIKPRYVKIDADQLTPRQRDILRLVSLGHTNREIADVLEISVRTVEVHRFNLMRRLKVRNVAQLFRRALQLGLLAAPVRLVA